MSAAASTREREISGIRSGKNDTARQRFMSWTVSGIQGFTVLTNMFIIFLPLVEIKFLIFQVTSGGSGNPSTYHSENLNKVTV